MAKHPKPPPTPVLAGFDDPPSEVGKLRFDLYKVRADEFRGRYDSMRELEWKILFQMYAGYAAITVAYDHLKLSAAPRLAAFVAVLATLVFYGAARYLTYRIEERLIVFDSTRLQYLAEIHALLETAEIPWKNRLQTKYHWSYRAQLILSSLVCISLVWYEATLGLTEFPPVVTAFLIVAALAILISLKLAWRVEC